MTNAALFFSMQPLCACIRTKWCPSTACYRGPRSGHASCREHSRYSFTGDHDDSLCCCSFSRARRDDRMRHDQRNARHRRRCSGRGCGGKRAGPRQYRSDHRRRSGGRYRWPRSRTGGGSAPLNGRHFSRVPRKPAAPANRYNSMSIRDSLPVARCALRVCRLVVASTLTSILATVILALALVATLAS